MNQLKNRIVNHLRSPSWVVVVTILAVSLGFLPPFLAGNHRCPVLREREARYGDAYAKPANARKYNVDCTYCHTVWPQLNREGLMFRYRGYRMPWEIPHHDLAQLPATGAAPPSPVGLTPAQRIAAGKKQYVASQCFSCHPGGGNIIDPSKPLKGPDFLKQYPKDADMARIIRQGIPGTAMPAYGKDRLSDDDLYNLVSYIRSLTPSP